MQTSNDTLLDSLNTVALEIKSIHKRVEHTDTKSSEEIDVYMDIITRLIRDLDHTLEKLETMRK